jgi:hypothetical protein
VRRRRAAAGLVEWEGGLAVQVIAEPSKPLEFAAIHPRRFLQQTPNSQEQDEAAKRSQ